MKTLKHQVSIYVPSTVNRNEPTDNAAIIKETQFELAKLFGGCTTTEAHGTYIADNGEMIDEPITIVSANAETLVGGLIDKVYALAEYIRERMSQESVAVTVDGAMYLI